MNKVPDILGFELKKAVEILGSEYELSIKETNSPKAKEEVRECRVIKQEYKNQHIELTISYF
ncbi:hypothetical protein [Crassaminicella indica]|uniref:PASTA domain-containing protein n=1 Tax=Crassaminicella indica TaxID=2855394 RepID=A0ABX8REG5_9CLOT|nr:hypothetical protein [Crassaminicella indica]QXM06115.1 hypothetical protein KVH43_12295 [Crassaminicella indica]